MDASAQPIKLEFAEGDESSPKRALLRDLMIAYANHDLALCLEWVEDDVVWNIIGEEQICGKADFAVALNQMREHEQARQITIHHIITHGNTASLNGVIQIDDRQNIEFCHIYRFHGFGKKAKLNKITTYKVHTT